LALGSNKPDKPETVAPAARAAPRGSRRTAARLVRDRRSAYADRAMGRSVRIVLILSLAVVFAGLGAQAQETGSADEVYVYTNADLEGLEPIPETTPCCREDYGGWDFVLEFIDREYERLDADRTFELQQRMNLVVAEDIDARGLPRPVGVPFFGINRFGPGFHRGVPAPVGRHGGGLGTVGKTRVNTNQPFVPFHATRSGGTITLTPRSNLGGARLTTGNRPTANPRLTRTSSPRARSGQ
jgi:hypothetical protein